MKGSGALAQFSMDIPLDDLPPPDIPTESHCLNDQLKVRVGVRLALGLVAGLVIFTLKY